MANLLAFIVSVIFSPFIAIPATVVATGFRYASDMEELMRWICGGFLFLLLIPSIFLFLQIHSGKATDPHVSVREQRIKPFLVGVLSSVLGIISLWFLDVGRPAISFALCYLVNAVAILLITVRWKVSVHASVFSACVVALAFSFGSYLLSLFLFLPVIGWARIHRGKHTPAQVAGGFIISSAISWAVLSATGV